MTEWFEEFKTYLPKYLSVDAQRRLFAELSQFPANIDGRLYTRRLQDEPTLFQGDGLASLWVADLPRERIDKTRVLVLSNTCDIAPDNKQLLGPRLLYCPIISFAKFETLLRTCATLSSDPANHLEAIRRQHNSAMFNCTTGQD